MRKYIAGALFVLSACGSDDQLIETVPAPEVPTTTAPPTTELPATTTTEPEEVTTTTEAYVAPATTAAPRARAVTTTTEYLHEQATTRSGSGQLASIRACESGGDYSAVSPDGLYYGAYQFHPGTWASVGGTGNPADASPAEQDMRAQMMIDAGRRGEWPNC